MYAGSTLKMIPMCEIVTFSVVVVKVATINLQIVRGCYFFILSPE